MKNGYYLLPVLLLIFSCASKGPGPEKQKEIATATQRLGEEYYNAGNYTAALKNLLEAEKTIPDDPYLQNSLGLVYMAKERYGLARDHFLKALKKKHDYVYAKNNLGAAYMKLRQWESAEKCFAQVAQNLLYNTPEIPYSNLGWVYYHQKRYEKSKKHFKKSLDLRPNFLIAIHGLATVYLETGNSVKALDFIHQALKRNPGAAILHSDLALIYESMNNFGQAEKSWNVVLKLVPETSPLARHAIERLAEIKRRL